MSGMTLLALFGATIAIPFIISMKSVSNSTDSTLMATGTVATSSGGITTIVNTTSATSVTGVTTAVQTTTPTATVTTTTTTTATSTTTTTATSTTTTTATSTTTTTATSTTTTTATSTTTTTATSTTTTTATSTTTTTATSTTTTTATSTTTTTATSTTTTTATSTTTTTATSTTTTTATSTTTSPSCSATPPSNLVQLTQINSWTFYAYNYTAVSTNPTLTFGFKGYGGNDYNYLDSVSVVDVSVPSMQLLDNVGFDNSSSLLNGWTTWCQSACGTGYGAILTSGCVSGYCYIDHCQSKYDYLAQSFSATIGHVYRISFYYKQPGGPQGAMYVSVAS